MRERERRGGEEASGWRGSPNREEGVSKEGGGGEEGRGE